MPTETPVDKRIAALTARQIMGFDGLIQPLSAGSVRREARGEEHAVHFQASIAEIEPGSAVLQGGGFDLYTLDMHDGFRFEAPAKLGMDIGRNRASMSRFEDPGASFSWI